ncbi:MAG: hypothetical protein KatS3mg124_1427 [Porticoccaceae bacterium]|nr:MAG: hypothetical protein KatS3mg124_1427 [Porticoccaceae bacterium]
MVWNARFTALALSLGLGLGFAAAGEARTVYRYVDPSGTVTFADSPPSHTADYAVIELPEPPPPPVEAPDPLEAIRAAADRLEEARRAREAERAPPPPPEPPPAEPPPEDRGPSYVSREWLPYPPAYRGETAPPVRFREPASAAERRREELRIPLKAPGFGQGKPLSERVKPYEPPPAD